MNRRLLVFFILVNALVSLTIAVTVVWIAEQRRPGPEELIVPATPAVVLMATPTSGDAQTAPEGGASPPATATAVAAAALDPGETEIYTVEAGDSLSAIAARYGVSSNRLMEINDLDDPNLVYVGQRLTIPVSQQQGGAPGGAAVGLPQRGLQLRIENAGELAAESVRVVNDSNGAVDLEGWTLSRDGGPIYTFGNILLLPGSGIRLNTGSGEENSINRYWGRDAAAWESGSTVVLRNTGGELIAQSTVAGGE